MRPAWPGGLWAGVDVLRLYPGTAARLHVALRWGLFPFGALLPFVPESGLAVDLGCGHGLWPLLLARARPGLHIHAIDPDADKIALARAAARAANLSNIQFSVGTAEEAALPPCHLISLVDVLYLVPWRLQEQLLARAAGCLVRGGRLLLKEMSERPRWKARWNRVQEFLSVRLLRITWGSGFYFREGAAWEALLRHLGLRTWTVRLDAGRPHPHLLLVGER
ncbi:MAG: class I SAM-dependent methyltransferase [Myxococcales bacterium]|nr:class I SAM-dependent methyltransferase [Myxococcales bacterium]